VWPGLEIMVPGEFEGGEPEPTAEMRPEETET